MDWSNEPYVKVYTRETDDDLALCWEARALWDRLLTKFDRSGCIETRRGARGLAAIARIPADVVERVLPELLEDGRLVAVDSGYQAPNFLAAQEASKSDKLRQRESRERRRAQQLGTAEAVTNRDRSSRASAATPPEASRARVRPDDQDQRNISTSHEAVTNRDRSSRDVTLCSADPDPDPVRSSAPRAHAIPPSREPSTYPVPGAEPEPDPLPSGASPEDPELLARRALGNEIWRELEAARARVAIALGVKLRPLPAMDPGRTALAMRIREAPDLATARADCEHVLRVREAEAVFKVETKWLSGSMFEERGWRTAVASSLPEAKRARASPGSPFGPPKTLRVRRDDDAPPPLLPLREKTR